MRNHEGYHDPTAGKAIRREMRKRKSCGNGIHPLTYKLSEVPGFKPARKQISR